MAQPDHPSPEQHYAARATHFRQRAQGVQQRIQRLSNARLLLFLLALVALLFVRHTPQLFGLTALVAAGVFVLLVIRHRAARADLRALHARIELCKVGISRCRREWDLIPVTLHDTADTDHPYARDLDLFGRPALTQLLGPVYTLHGKRTLRHWLLAGAPQEIVDARQHAVRVLARDIDFREALAVAAQRTVGRGQQHLDHFISWIADAKLAPPAPAALWFARVIPIMTVALVIAHATDIVDRAWWLLPLALSTIFTSFTLRRIYRTFDAAFTRDPAPLFYTHAFEVAQQLPADGFTLEQIKDRLHNSGQPAAARIKRLEQIMLYADVRHSGTASFLLEIFFQWSFHIWVALRSWQEEAGSDVLPWFEALGELEALCSLATLSHDQPEWCFPNLDIQAQQIVAVQLGHPMLENERRVHNDVIVGPRGTFLFVTGSNMSGKSTLLRAIGVNTVLAQAGAPVCALRYRAPPLRLYTSINVRDSLAGGVSLYMAQLRRIKTIIDAASEQSELPCCYLLDEILSGTNSTDRTTAVRAIVHQLLDLHAIGALATHDLALVTDEKIRTAGKAIHFSETVNPETGAMTFDYRIRPGTVRTSNALALMKLMGISVSAPRST